MLFDQFIAQAGIVGFESPASQYEETSLSLTELLITSPSSMYLTKSPSHDLAMLGIFKDDVLIVNEDVSNINNRIITGTLNDEPIIALFNKHKRQLLINTRSRWQQLTDHDELAINGVIEQSIRLHCDISDQFTFNDYAPDIDNALIKYPSATYFGLAQGNSMLNEGIHDGDVLIVDRHQFVHDGAIIVATLNNEFVCKKLDKKQRMLISTRPYTTYKLNDNDRFQVEGCVIASIRLHQRINRTLG